MRHFSRRYRCVAFNARGYPPSEVPAGVSRYSQQQATRDIINLMRHLGIGHAHLIGCSMGAYTTLRFGLACPRRALSPIATDESPPAELPAPKAELKSPLAVLATPKAEAPVPLATLAVP